MVFVSTVQDSMTCTVELRINKEKELKLLYDIWFNASSQRTMFLLANERCRIRSDKGTDRPIIRIIFDKEALSSHTLSPIWLLKYEGLVVDLVVPWPFQTRCKITEGIGVSPCCK